MGIRINTNVESLIAQSRLGRTRRDLSHTQNKLSSGSRIIESKDDAAGLAISEKLRASMRATAQTLKNAQNGFFLMETAEGALNEITNIVVRMKELAVQAASDTNGDNERGYLNNEYQALKLELDRISATTTFNGRPLLTGEGGVVAIQVGPNNDDDIDRIVIAADFEVNLAALGLADHDIGTSDGAKASLEGTEEAIDYIAGVRGAIGAQGARLQSTVNNLEIYNESITRAFSQIRDADLAAETSEFAKLNIMNQAGVAVLAQANSTPALALKLLE